jgi:hypothetical protein
MSSKATELTAFEVKNRATAIHHRIRAFSTSLVLALACAAVVSPALARTPYDGDWSVVILTHTGACDASYRVGLQIEQGKVISDGLATVEGRVTPGGTVRITVSAGSQRARLRPSQQEPGQRRLAGARQQRVLPGHVDGRAARLTTALQGRCRQV